MSLLVSALVAIGSSSVVTGIISALEIGGTISSIFRLIKDKTENTSIEFRIAAALDTSLEKTCLAHKLEYDYLAINRIESIDYDSVRTKDNLAEILKELIGPSFNEDEVKTWTENFVQEVSRDQELYNYLDRKDTAETKEKIDKIEEKIDKILEIKEKGFQSSGEDVVNLSKDKSKPEGIILYDEAEEYRYHFEDENLFLNKGDRELHLAQVYQPPAVTENANGYYDVEKEFASFFERELGNSINEDNGNGRNRCGKRVLTVLGKPGTGKTSLIQYIVSNQNIKDIIEQKGYKHIHVKRFSQLENIEWDSYQNEKTMVESLIEACGFEVDAVHKSYGALEGRILILDGFDEIETQKERNELLQKIYDYFNNDHFKDITRFFLIITCREEYIRDSDKKNYFMIQPMSRELILNFVKKYNAAMKDLGTPEGKEAMYPVEIFENENLYENKNEKEGTPLSEIIGIPVILYMIVAKMILITDKNRYSTIADIYDEIFKTDGGIFDPFDYSKYQTTKPEREKQLQINEKLLKISKLIAVYMFQYSSDKTNCEDDKVEAICEKSSDKLISCEELKKRVKCDNYIRQGDNDTKPGIPVIEGSSTITFVHRSIYEYLVASYIFDQIEKLNFSREKESKESKTLRIILQTRELSPNIKTFLVQKMESRAKKNHYEMDKMCEDIKDLFEDCLEKEKRFLYSEGTKELDFADKSTWVINPGSENPMSCMRHELICFLNMLFLVKEAKKISIKQKQSGSAEGQILYTANKESRFYQYVKQSISASDEESNKNGNSKEKEAFIPKPDFSSIYMPEIDLSRMDFSGVNFDFCDLSNSHLEHCTFRGASIKGTVFSESRMEYCVLRGAETSDGEKEFCKIDFKGSYMQNSDLQSCYLKGADFSGCHLEDSNMYLADLEGAEFVGAYLNGTDLAYSELNNAKFQKAYLIHTNLEAAKLDAAKFAEADGNNAADITDSNFLDAVITPDTIFDEMGKAEVIRGNGRFPEREQVGS